MIHLLLALATLFTGITSFQFWIVEHSKATQGADVHWTSCQNNTDVANTSPDYIKGMQKCFDGYNTAPDNWDGMNCNGAGWFKGGDGGYANAQNCYAACKPCIDASIAGGSADVKCWDVFGTPGPISTGGSNYGPGPGKWIGCHMGFHPS